MAPTAHTYTYATTADIQALLSVDGLAGRVDDDNSGVSDSTETAYISSAIEWATARCNMFLASRYREQDLATSWAVNNWCIILAAHWLSSRRGNPPPEAIRDLYEEAIEDLKAINAGTFQLNEIGTRGAQWPAWSNVRVDCLAVLRKVRVERYLSEDKGGQPDFTRDRDLGAELMWAEPR